MTIVDGIETEIQRLSGIETKPQNLSYDKAIKKTLTQSNELTIRFINGLFGDDIPLDAPVDWLGQETINDKNDAVIADFYPRIGGSMYHIEVEHDDNGDMALRVFKYMVGGAILHNMTATDSQLSITFPKPCVVFLKSRKNTPTTLTWNVKFFDGQAVTLRIPTIRLADLSVKEIAARNLLPIGQFYLRTFEPLTESKEKDFLEAAAALLKELKDSVDAGLVPHYIGLQMQDTIKAVISNTITRSRLEVGFDMNTNLVETLPWIDYREIFQKIEERGEKRGEERGEKRGEERGKATRDMEIALNAIRQVKPGRAVPIETLKSFGIAEDIIRNAQRQIETERAERRRSEPQR
ncbi:MAG: hypothetical protein LBK56_02555 [Gracilibacteraceae bacterium]|jgi:hypothetical protein|nr:hypothetical protein [Gracilibacteraceae bacterium]